MSVSKAHTRASIKYNEANMRQVKFNFSLKYDTDILAYLDSLPNKQGYIKALIRADIAARQAKKAEPMKYTVDCAFFKEGQGYSHTETVDVNTTTEIFTAEEYITKLRENGAKITIKPGEAIDVTVRIWAAGADPMFDDPVSESTTTLTEE